jgi:DNA-dependent RNA polymerase auxiliary subunit epsilon
MDNLKKQIESLNKTHHLEIFKIFKKNNIPFSENKNGIFINIANIDKNVINEIEYFLNYINAQENELISIEKQKKEFKQNFFT